ncbi:hypothetical protein PoB_003489700 [Plakobranchus ocellatus]|uniref:Peptidase S1 domain-containing protein n=1 Tax=Plakobranchus ocellatus TaxID=259542 RepID=A0AAV4AM98_9GAST|nr:hypothetical protein PoB_003489700 [Plakobranchus ocellatus]
MDYFMNCTLWNFEFQSNFAYLHPPVTSNEFVNTSCVLLVGYHEVSYECGTDLQKRLIDCPKYSNHSCYTPLQKFTLDKLPKGYRDPDIYKFVKVQAELTVRVVSTITSASRPDGYAFHEFKGQGRPRFGTGFIQYMYRDDTRSNKTCPCPECIRSGNPKKEYYKIKVRTATHVVFNKEESLGTYVELYFDGFEGSHVKRLYGESVAFGAIQGDWCDIRCVSHDIKLCEHIKEVWGQWRWLETKINSKYQHEDEEGRRLVVVVSHPHGCHKQVSIGHWLERYVVDHCRGWENCVYTYDAPTCPGSSGAPIWILGKMKWAGFFGRHPHSGRTAEGEGEGFNLSGVGLDKK